MDFHKINLSNFHLLTIAILLALGSQILFGQSNSLKNRKFDNLEFEIIIDDNNFIKGQIIEVFIKISNKGNKEMVLYPKDCQLVLINDLDSTKNESLFMILYSMSSIKIKPSNTFYMSLDLNLLFDFHNMIANHSDYLWMIIEKGKYSIYLNSNKILNQNRSDKKSFEVHPVPDSLKEAYLNLSSKEEWPDTPTGLSTTTLDKFKKYKNTVYEKEFFIKVIRDYYMYILTSKTVDNQEKENAKKVIRKFILEYPNTYNSIRFYYLLLEKINMSVEKSYLLSIYNEVKRMDVDKMPFKKNLFLERFKKYKKVGVESYLTE